MGFIFERRRLGHWLDDGAIACGAKLTKSQFERQATDGWTRDAQGMQIFVTCPKCIAKVRKRLRELSDSEEEYAKRLRAVIWPLNP